MKKKMWLVPIRYWEDSDPIQFDLIVDGVCDLTGLPLGPNYGFHHGYGHNAYELPQDIFPTRKAAKAEISRRRVAREKKLDEWADNFVERLKKDGHL